ncbi:hypothetical protein O6H91_02G089300 [Diphasiastrum complanatum]|uniref:Uncharacterized protein n=1 Tax=Diphasiastrum complanatum TaxID=34168 RepID=A0ACC2EIA1_DIPCM|nr:hypothetical protein O6H91_02G089300 [Diphasiastrum complanatum]
MKVVELQVPMRRQECERKIRRSLSNMIGVESVNVDMRLQKVTVMGYVDQMKVLKKVRGTVKRAEFWPQQTNNHYIAYSPYTSVSSLHKYDHDYGYEQHYRPVQDDKVTTLFTDENPHACSIM